MELPPPLERPPPKLPDEEPNELLLEGEALRNCEPSELNEEREEEERLICAAEDRLLFTVLFSREMRVRDTLLTPELRKVELLPLVALPLTELEARRPAPDS